MQHVMVFNLPEDESELVAARNGMEYYLALFDIDNWLRERSKYSPSENGEFVKCSEVRARLREILAERGVSLEDIA